jgi:Flp pilus assembly protein TadD
LNIPCIHCLTPNEVTLPPANSDGLVPPISVRCKACGNVFSSNTPKKKRVSPWDAPSADVPNRSLEQAKVEPPRRVAPSAAAYPHQPKYVPPKPITYTINQDGNIYQVQDLAAVQRWIVENRLTRDGKISTDGQWWDRLGDRPEFKSFFEMLDKIQALESRPEPAPVIQNSEPPQIQRDPISSVPRVPSYEAERPLMVAKQEPIEPKFTPQAEELEFVPPATEEIPFDRPHTDEHATVTSMIAQESVSEPIFTAENKTPELPQPVIEESTAPGRSIYDQYPSFSDTDLPTEEELNIAQEDAEEDHAIAFVDEEWPTEQMGLDDDLEWVSAKQQKQRIVLGLVLVILIGITAKTVYSMRSGPEELSTTVELAAVDTPEEVDAEEDNLELAPEELEDNEEAVEAEEEELVSSATVASEPATTTRARPANTTPTPTARRSPPPPREPETATAFITSGRESMAEGDYRAARFSFLEAVAIEPQNPEANHGLAFAAHRQNDIPFAMRYYCRALELAQPSSALANDIQSSLDDLHLECEG